MVDNNRSIWKYIFFSALTGGIYGFYFIHKLAEDANIICEGDGEHTAGIFQYMLLCIVTFGIYGIVWEYKLAERLWKNAARYDFGFSEDGKTVVLWTVFGTLLFGIGPFIALHIIINNMNTLATEYLRENYDDTEQSPYGWKADVVSTHRCLNCGYENADSALFCLNCGMKLDKKEKQGVRQESEKPDSHQENNNIWENVPAAKDVPEIALKELKELSLEEVSEMPLKELSMICKKYIEDNVEEMEKFVECVSINPALREIEDKLKGVENAQINQLMKRGYMELEDSEWKTADECFEQALSYDAECAKVYWGKVLVNYKKRNNTELAESGVVEEDNKYVRRALRFATEEQKQQFNMILNAQAGKTLYLSALIFRVLETDRDFRLCFETGKVVSADILMQRVPEYGWLAGGWENKQIANDLKTVKIVLQDNVDVIKEDSIVDVQLISLGNNSMAVLTEFTDIVGVDSYTAKDFLQNLPVTMKKSIPAEQAQQIKKRMQVAGARVKLLKKEG
ncbi:MAG: ribosomal protein L7/L12 [Butyribacter sp.]|nr:ribosomal protein L7/L12 [Butyribacter sp.]